VTASSPVTGEETCGEVFIWPSISIIGCQSAHLSQHRSFTRSLYRFLSSIAAVDTESTSRVNCGAGDFAPFSSALNADGIVGCSPSYPPSRRGCACHNHVTSRESILTRTSQTQS
jgi:hypothetical protein